MAFYGMRYEETESIPIEDQDGLLANLPAIEAYRSWYRANERDRKEFVQALAERVMKDRPMDAMQFIQDLILKKD